VALYRVEPGAIVLSIRLTPGADRDAVEGIGVLADGRAVAHVRVRARPHDGEANAALVKLLSKTFRRPKSAIEIVSGASGRVKDLRIAGNTIDLAAVVAGWLPKD
jgi:uncharacterized protein (TIGR00251 family)